ncbi:hypothetical protein GGI12_005249 [Dipsacomyces acuminosporus]|nr:hypothetical protein GGI12_005249 [Dipsacomyces acuminosporus]
MPTTPQNRYGVCYDHDGRAPVHGGDRLDQRPESNLSFDMQPMHAGAAPVNIARTSKTFHVVIIGGSFAGIRAAQDLEQLLPPHCVTITVIERRDRYFYNLGALRAIAKPELIDLIWLPYDRVFHYPHNRVIQGEVTAVYPNSVILSGGRKIDFDSLLVATGSIYPPPCKVEPSSYLQGKAEQRMYSERLKSANSVLIIGGGPTGVGLAAEIATQYPQKSVTIVHSGPRLIRSENNGESFSRKAHKKLTSLGVNIILNERIDVPDSESLTYHVECRWLKTSKGRMVFSDLQFLCNGILFNTSFMDTLDPVFKDNIIDPSTKQIRVLSTMQISHPELPWIFAAGDVCNTQGEKQAYRADSQGSHVARCMARMAHAWAQGDSKWYNVPLRQWHDPAQFMAVAMGPTSGVTETPWIVLGDLPTRIMKSKELFLARRYKEFNLEFPGFPRSSSTMGMDTRLKRRTASQGNMRSSRHNQEQHRRAQGSVVTDLSSKNSGPPREIVSAVLAAAEHLDHKYDCDRISLSRPLARKAPSANLSSPYSAFYAQYRQNLSDVEDSGSNSSYEYEGEQNNAMSTKENLHGQTAIPSPSPSSSSSFGVDPPLTLHKAPSYASIILQGPVLPRSAKERRTAGRPVTRAKGANQYELKEYDGLTAIPLPKSP